MSDDDLDAKLAKARRFRDPARRARAEARVLEEMAIRDGGGEPEHLQRRERRVSGGGTLKKGS